VLKDMNYAAYCPYSLNANLYLVSFAVVMNKQKYDSLPVDVKKAIESLAREHAEWTGEYVDNHVNESITWSKKTMKHENTVISSTDRVQIEKLLKPVIDAYVKRVAQKGINGKALIEEAKQSKVKYDRKGK